MSYLYTRIIIINFRKMKKVFLSIASFAMLAGAFTACGSDDSTKKGGGNNNGGGEEPTPAPTSYFTYKGEKYGLDTTEMNVEVNANNKVVAYEIPVGQDTVLATRWYIASWNGDINSSKTSTNYHQVGFYVPLSSDGKIVYPNESQTLILSGAGVYANNASTPEDLGQVTNITLNFNALTESVVQNGQVTTVGKIDYTSKIVASKGTVDLTFNGDFYGVGTFTPTPQSRGVVGFDVKNVSLSKKGVNIKELDIVKVK